MNLPSTERFTSRVDNYVRYRPSYPSSARKVLETECGLGPHSFVADVGSGTGISTRFLLESGATVYAVEPNAEMRAAAEAALGDNPRFRSVDATAEATTLPDASVDLILAGQAFHWFDRVPTQAEFRRILRPDGWVWLMWNERKEDDGEFSKGYEQLLLQFAIEYVEVRHRNIAATDLATFFREGTMRVAELDNAQSFDLEGLKGRLLSSSYVPEPGHPNYEPAMKAIEDLFARTQVDDRVTFEYDTRIYYGRL